MHYHYALGNIYNAEKMFERAFNHFSKANEFKRKTMKFDSGQHSQFVDQLIDVYSNDFFAARHDYGSDSIVPVYLYTLFCVPNR